MNDVGRFLLVSELGQLDAENGRFVGARLDGENRHDCGREGGVNPDDSERCEFRSEDNRQPRTTKANYHNSQGSGRVNGLQRESRPDVQCDGDEQDRRDGEEELKEQRISTSILPPNRSVERTRVMSDSSLCKRSELCCVPVVCAELELGGTYFG